MIDYEKSAKLNGMKIEELKDYFDKYPKSDRKVIRICEDCGEGQELKFCNHSDLCRKCSHLRSYKKNPERAKKISDTNKKIKSTEEYYNKVSKSQLKSHRENPERAIRAAHGSVKYYIENPEKRKEKSEITSKRLIKRFAEQSFRDALSESVKNSDAHKLASENMRGGNDIINHHWLYDDADLSKYTMLMTRSEHTVMHNRMRENGYGVKHINSETDDNGLWGYK